MEGWTRVRLAGQTDWKRFWMIVQVGAGNQVMNGENSSSSSVTDITSSPSISRRNRMSNFFSRIQEHHPSEPLPTKSTIYMYDSPKIRDKRKPAMTMTDVTQVFAVYPERPELISRSTLIKVEGFMGDDEATGTGGKDGWILMMPEVEGGKVGSTEMLKWLVGEWSCSKA